LSDNIPEKREPLFLPRAILALSKKIKLPNISRASGTTPMPCVFTKIFLLLVVVGAYLFMPWLHNNVQQWVFLLSMDDGAAVRGYMESTGAWAGFTSIGLMVFQAVLAPLPDTAVTFANAALFGWVWGAAWSWVGTLLGAALCYGLGFGYGRALMQRVAPPEVLLRLDTMAKRWGHRLVLVARLLPWVPFDPLSYAAGVAGMSFWRFLLVTGIGQLPATLIYSWAGDLLAVDMRLLAAVNAAVLVVSALLFLWNHFQPNEKQA
jgi:uncharacterized membrane protein YdjX (TVP38/TMEM64 family)